MKTITKFMGKMEFPNAQNNANQNSNQKIFKWEPSISSPSISSTPAQKKQPPIVPAATSQPVILPRPVSHRNVVISSPSSKQTKLLVEKCLAKINGIAALMSSLNTDENIHLLKMKPSSIIAIKVGIDENIFSLMRKLSKLAAAIEEDNTVISKTKMENLQSSFNHMQNKIFSYTEEVKMVNTMAPRDLLAQSETLDSLMRKIREIADPNSRRVHNNYNYSF